MHSSLAYAFAASVIFLAFKVSASHAAETTARSYVAIDAHGVLHRSSDYHGKHPPWMDDQVKTMGAEYPYWDRRSHHEGAGLFRLMLDLKTGAASNITVVKSTGFRSLDDSALIALRQWRWKPGKWKQIEMPITFTMAAVPRPLPPGAVLLPNPKPR
jgi:TonB family protein